jgi:hypothetical protein
METITNCTKDGNDDQLPSTEKYYLSQYLNTNITRN